MVNPIRLIRHLLTPGWLVHLKFNHAAMQQITAAIEATEATHAGEIRFAVEAALPLGELLKNCEATGRAVELFSRLRIWDTEHNNGVLIYLLLADRNVEIVADRGIYRKVDAREWEEIALAMEQLCREGDFVAAVTTGVHAVSRLLGRHFPAQGEAVNELPDEPVIVA